MRQLYCSFWILAAIALSARAENSPPLTLENLRAGTAHFDRSQVVSFEDVESNLRLLNAKRDVAEQNGYWGPGSAMWEVAKEDNLSLFFGVIGYTELLHPGGAQGLFDHSQIMVDPEKRLERTNRKILDMIYGPKSQADAFARQLNKMHGFVTGSMPFPAGYYRKGDRYFANEYSALLLVHMAHWGAVYKLYEFLHGRQPIAFRDRFFSETVTFAMLLGLPVALIPSSEHEFSEMLGYLIEQRVLEVTPTTAKIIRSFETLAEDRIQPTLNDVQNLTTALSWLINPIGNLLAPKQTGILNRCIGALSGQALVQSVSGAFAALTYANLDPRIPPHFNMQPETRMNDQLRARILSVLPRKTFAQYSKAQGL